MSSSHLLYDMTGAVRGIGRQQRANEKSLLSWSLHSSHGHSKTGTNEYIYMDISSRGLPGLWKKINKITYNPLTYTFYVFYKVKTYV